MKEKEFERRLDKKIQGHAKIMSDEKRKKIHMDILAEVFLLKLDL